MLVALVLLSSQAVAGLFGEKTMRGPWLAPVDAELVLPRGVWALEVGGTHKVASSVRGAFGVPVAYDDASFQHSTLSLGLSEGLSDRTTLYLRVPWVFDHLSNGRGADLSTSALGDAHAGVLIQPWLAREGALALQVDLKSPSGMEWPANTTGGAAYTEGFLTGTGTTNASAFVLGRLRPGPWALDARVGYTHKFASVVGYVMEVGGFGNGWLKPGDELRADTSTSVQVAKGVTLGVNGTGRRVGSYFIGVSGEGTTKLETYWLGGEEPYTYADGTTETIETSPSGWFVDVGGSAVLERSPQLALAFHASWSLVGTDGRFFSHLGLEEFSPHPGLTLGASTTVRW